MSGVSLYNPMTVLGKQPKAFEHPYKGKVVEVDSDPEHLGRIKVSIPELYGDYVEGSEGTLPWIYPRYLGKFNNTVGLDIPDKGQVVEIIFPYKNIYLGYYTNKPIFKDVWDNISSIDPELGSTLQQAFLTNYPNVYGSFDRNLTGWYIDKVTDEIFFVQGTTKASFKLDTQGSLHISIPKSVYVDITEDLEINVGRDVKINVGNDVTSTVANDVTSTISNNLNNTVTGKITTKSANMDLNVTSTLNLTSSTNNITTPTTNVTGQMIVSVDVVADGISLIGHTHTVPQSPSGTQESMAPTK